jgi:hypothetical protein
VLPLVRQEADHVLAPRLVPHERPGELPQIGPDPLDEALGDLAHELVAKTLLVDGLPELLPPFG